MDSGRGQSVARSECATDGPCGSDDEHAASTNTAVQLSCRLSGCPVLSLPPRCPERYDEPGTNMSVFIARRLTAVVVGRADPVDCLRNLRRNTDHGCFGLLYCPCAPTAWCARRCHPCPACVSARSISKDSVGTCQSEISVRIESRME